MPAQEQTSDQVHQEAPVLLAVLDILGFSNRVRSTSLSEVLELYNLLRERTVKRCDIQSFDLLKVDIGHVPAILCATVESVVFSDSVFAWVPMRRGFASPFLKWCCDFVCEGLALDVPIRGAIAAGNAILNTDTDTFIGTPILEAHSLEQNQNWLGLAFCRSVMWPPLVADIHPELLMEYKIPVKKGEPDPLAPDWPRIWRNQYGDECPSAKLREIAARQEPKYRDYYLNAANFAEHSAKHSNWYNETQPEGAFLRMRPYDEVIEDIRKSETDGS